MSSTEERNSKGMFVLGVTGGIAAGKSFVLSLLSERMGFRVLQTDRIAKELMQPDTPLFQALCGAFSARGHRITDETGGLNRERYRELIFSDRSLRLLSDSLVHPAVWDEAERRIAEAESGVPLALETAIPGARFRALCDRVLLVTAPEEIRMRRLLSERGIPAETAGRLLKGQPEEAVYGTYADLLFPNGAEAGQETAEETEARLRKLLLPYLPEDNYLYLSGQ